MRLAVAWALACLLCGACPFPAPGGEAPLARQTFAGEWVTADKDAAYQHLAITAQGEAWSLEAWCAGDDRDRPGRKVGLSLFGAESGAKSRPYGFATVEFDLATCHSTLRVEKGELVVETVTTYKLQPERNYRTVDRFKKL
jgi:hypothetical protein